MSRDKNYTPEEIKQLWEEYKDYIKSIPDKIQVATGKGVQTLDAEKPYQKKGFYSYVYNKYQRVIHQYFDNEKGSYGEFLDITTHIRNECEVDQVGGTLTGKYKAPNLTARINGIADNNQTNVKVEQPLFSKDQPKQIE